MLGFAKCFFLFFLLMVWSLVKKMEMFSLGGMTVSSATFYSFRFCKRIMRHSSDLSKMPVVPLYLESKDPPAPKKGSVFSSRPLTRTLFFITILHKLNIAVCCISDYQYKACTFFCVEVFKPAVPVVRFQQRSLSLKIHSRKKEGKTT